MVTGEATSIAALIQNRQDQLDKLEQLQDLENTEMLDKLAEDNERPIA